VVVTCSVAAIPSRCITIKLLYRQTEIFLICWEDIYNYYAILFIDNPNITGGGGTVIVCSDVH
jgi:hypothetical protein